MFGVIWSHLLLHWGQLNSHFGRHVTDWLFAFHTPAFTLISGFCTPPTHRGLVQLLVTYYVGAVLCGVAWIGCKLAINGAAVTWAQICFLVSQMVATRWEVGVQGGPWYLLALFAWRLAAPAIRDLKYPVLTGFVLSLSGPYSIGCELGALREMFYYLPYFIIGLRYPNLVQSALACNVLVRFIALAVLLSAFFCFHVGILGSWVHNKMATPFESGGVFCDIGRYGFGVVLAWCSIAVCSTKPTPWIATLGRRSVHAYVLHRVVVIPVGILVRVNIPLDSFSDCGRTCFLAGLAFVAAVLLSAPALDDVSRILQPRWLVPVIS